MIRRSYASKLIFALIGTFAIAGCSDRMSLDVLSETEDPVYRRAKDLLSRNLYNEALSQFTKIISKRSGNAPESHLEAGLIHLDHMDDQYSAIYHFKHYLVIKSRDPDSSERSAGMARVEDLIKTAKKDLLTTEDAKNYRLKLLDTIEQLRRENETLKSRLAEAGNSNLNTPQNRQEPERIESVAPNRQLPARLGKPPAAGTRTYVVKEGDSLYKISSEVYGNGGRWMEILKANSSVLPSERQLQPGMFLVIP